MSDINVTPFVDVMLVLLVVFMVTAPLLTVAVPIVLPKTEAQMMGHGTRSRWWSRVSIRPAWVYLQENMPRSWMTLVAEAEGDHRLQPGCAHLRARRQERILWPHHGSDGHYQRGGLQ